VAFSGNGKILASGGTDDTIRLWDVATHRQIGSPLTGHADWVRSVAFSPDGKTLASGSADGTVRLWDVATRRQIGDPLSADTSQVYSVAFSPDGKTLASGSADGTVRLWSVAYLTGTAPRLCGSVRRSVTASEWAQYARSGPAYQSVCP
jgi:WD40 repeat protein